MGAVGILGIILPVGAQTYSWTNTTNSNSWFTDGNWDLAGIPDSPGERAVVGGFADRSTVVNGTATIDSLTVTADAVLVVPPGHSLSLVPAGLSVLENNAGNSATSSFLVQAGGTVSFGGMANNLGIIELGGDSTSGGSFLVRSGGGLITGSGAVELGARAAGLGAVSGNPRLTNAVGHTLRGYGNIGNNAISVTNNGTIQANEFFETLFLDPAEIADDGLTAFINNGTIRASSDGIVTLRPGRYTNNGSIEASTDSDINLESVADITNFEQTTDFFGDPVYVLNGGTYRVQNGSLAIAPAGFDLTVNNASIELSGTFQSNTLFDTTASGQSVSQNFRTNNGTILVRSGARLRTTQPSVTNTGTLTVGAGSTFTVDHPAKNLVSTGAGVVAGSGTIVATLSNYNEAAISPGDTPGSTGLLVIDGSVDFSAGTTFEIDVLSATNADTLAVRGRLSLGDNATTIVVTLGGYVPNVGDEFSIAIVDDGITGSVSAVMDNSDLVDFEAFISPAGGNLRLRTIAAGSAPTPPPNSAPTVAVTGRAKIVTERSRVTIKGTSTDDQRVASVSMTYRKIAKNGKKKTVTRAARLSGDSWTFKYRPKQKRTVFTVMAVDDFGVRSNVARVKVIRK